MTGIQEFVVTTEHAIDFADDQMPAVLCTPSLIWFLEHAARAAVLPVLEPGESTVGVSIDVRHLAPTPMGSEVTCRARVILVDGALVCFQLEAHDDVERIACGSHKLRIIRKDRFARRVQQKAASK
jgi:predicted thioesterase